MERELLEKIVSWRRHLHTYPELSTQEHQTASFVQARLREMDIPFVAGVGGTGVVATLSRAGSAASVALRADMDALPIQEETGLPHASRNSGVMHACGHDGHTASLLGAAQLLANSPDWKGTIHLVFQPAEEGFRGAESMMADGLLERFPFERIFGFHNWPGLAAGTLACHSHAVMAGGSRVTITIHGHAGHAALPHLTRDPVVVAGHLIVALQSIVSRNVDPLEPAVLSLGAIEGGAASNQIPDKVVMLGTIRSHKLALMDQIECAVQRICAGVAASFGVDIDVQLRRGAGPVINTPAEAKLALAAANALGLETCQNMAPSMVGEDFSEFLRHRPGAFVWIGNGIGDPGTELHCPRYEFNDAILPASCGWLASVACRALAVEAR